DGLELRSFNWQVQPLAGNRVESSFFEDRALFPPGSVQGTRISKSNWSHDLQPSISRRNLSFQPLSNRLPRMLPLRPFFFSRHKASRRNKDMFSALCPVRIRDWS